MKMAALAVHHRSDVLQEIRRAAGPCACRRTTRKPSHGAVRPLNRDTPSLWFRKAADQGGVDGQHSLGQIFEMGVGVPQDNGKAYVWFKLAASPAEDDANPRRDKQQADVLATNMTPAQTAEAQSTRGLAREAIRNECSSIAVRLPFPRHWA
jgi:Sel1 repeat